MSITGLHYVQQMEVLRQEKVKLGDELNNLLSNLLKVNKKFISSCRL